MAQAAEGLRKMFSAVLLKSSAAEQSRPEDIACHRSNLLPVLTRSQRRADETSGAGAGYD
jgi:hypothetical protein